MPTAAQISAPPSIYWHLSPAVVLVTCGRGREVFDDSRRLFARLAELPALGDQIMALHRGTQHADARSVEALGAMIELVGFKPFFRICATREGPERALRTRWCWEYLDEYLPLYWVRT